MRLSNLSFIFIAIYFIAGVGSECCFRTLIRFKPDNPNSSCSEFDGAEEKRKISNNGVVRDIFWKLDRSRPKCWIEVCGDGTNAPGSYCGKKTCSGPFPGCGCDECIPGNDDTAFAKFMEKHGPHLETAKIDSVFNIFTK